MVNATSQNSIIILFARSLVIKFILPLTFSIEKKIEEGRNLN